MTTKFPQHLRLILPGAVLIGLSITSMSLFKALARTPSPQQCGSSGVLVIGQKDQTAFAITGSIVGTGGLANTTIYWNITQDNAGVLVFSINPAGPYTSTITVPMALDNTGSGSVYYYVKGQKAGHTVIIESSPQCGGGSPQCNGFIPPADYDVKPCACPPIIPSP